VYTYNYVYISTHHLICHFRYKYTTPVQSVHLKRRTLLFITPHTPVRKHAPNWYVNSTPRSSRSDPQIRPGSYIFKVKVTLRLAVSQSLCRRVDPTLGFVTRYYFLSEACCHVSAGRPLWREVGFLYFEVEVEVALRLTVSQSVCISVELTVELVTRYYFLSEGCCLEVAFLFLWGALSDERTDLQFSVQSLNGPSRTESVIRLYGLIWDSPNLEGQIPLFISPKNRVAQLYPGHWVSFTSPLTTRRVTVFEVEVEATLRLTVSQSVCLRVEPTLELVIRYYFLSEDYYMKVVVLFLWGAGQGTGLQWRYANPPPTRGPGPHIYIYISPRNHLVPFTSPLTTGRATVEAFWPSSNLED
jgi:hypothetical protein